MTSIPPGFEALFAALTDAGNLNAKDPATIDGSEVREVTISVTGWVDASLPLSAYAGAIECAAVAAGMSVYRVSVEPDRRDR